MSGRDHLCPDRSKYRLDSWLTGCDGSAAELTGVVVTEANKNRVGFADAAGLRMPADAQGEESLTIRANSG